MALPPRPMWQVVGPPIGFLITAGVIGVIDGDWMIPALALAALIGIAWFFWATRVRGGLPPPPPETVIQPPKICSIRYGAVASSWS